MSRGDVAADMEMFRELFAPSMIRPLLNWDRLMRLCPTVRSVVMSSPRRLGDLYTTWYLDEAGLGEIDYQASERRPLTVREAASRVSELNTERATHLHGLQGHSGPYAMLAPLYRVAEGRFLILDGNHRLVAAHQVRRELRLLGLAIDGPLDPVILPDLVFWGSPDLPVGGFGAVGGVRRSPSS